jgi:S-DNA-T family DNA segregation ATPase FtsK/SpoIIIE
MNADELIGRVAQRYLSELLEQAIARSNGETARFVLDMLTPTQVGAIVNAIRGDAGSGGRWYIQIKEAIARSAHIPPEYHTRETEVWFRNHEPPKGEPALLIATDGDDQRESLEELTRITALDLKSASKLWVDVAARDLPLTEPQRTLWTTALEGLAAARDVSLQAFAEYVAATRDALHGGGEPLLAALGQALPELRLPRDSGVFEAIREGHRGRASAWRKRFESLFSDRAPLLTKHQKTGQAIEREDLKRQLTQLSDDGLIPDTHRPIFDAFIDSPASWSAAARAIAELEWEQHHVEDLFSGLRVKRDSNLGVVTRQHFSDEGIALTDEDDDYLKVLEAKTSFKQSDDPPDRDFYERHVHNIGRDTKLKAKWDSFIFGAAVTCDDLLEGIVSAISRLCARVPDWNVQKRLEIRVHGRGDKYFRELNADLATLFGMRYRGLKYLFGSRVTFDLGRLDDYGAFLEEQYERGFKKRNQASSRTATTIRLDVKLSTEHGVDYVVQVHWTGNPLSVATNLAEDLQRLSAEPLVSLEVERNRVSRKGEAQRLSVSNYMSFEPAYGQDAGTLVPREDNQTRWESQWRSALKSAQQRGALTAAIEARALSCFDTFLAAYRRAIEKLRAGEISDASILGQAEAFGALLASLHTVLPADMDVSRKALIEPLLSLGIVQVPDRSPAAVIAPWHPLRLASVAVKARRVAAFVNHVLEAPSVDFGDQALFFRDFIEQLRHPHYPEVAVGYQGESPHLLVVTDTHEHYSLAEDPRPADREWRSDSDPTDASERVRDIVRRYLELQPHENANLSVALYNCEAAGLPIAAVEALSTLQEDDVHCHVVLRHHDPAILQRVYTELLEHADADPDALVASETSKNFMAKLRVGIQLETPATLGPRDARAVDIAFLDDVISRRAHLTYPPSPSEGAPPDLLTHVPGQWSYRVPVGIEQTRAMRYLVCPEQPECSREHLRATLAIIEPQTAETHYRLPARQLSFQDHRTETILKEVHELAEWVVNYDDLLEPGQLRNAGISIIRYRRDRTRGRSLIISSTSQSGMLLALVLRRLEALQLSLSAPELKRLAEKLIHDAIGVSGEIALRATKRGVFAGELIGVVLSRALVQEELGPSTPQAWYFLDDYAHWLGQREGGIADLIVLSPAPGTVTPALRVRVCEAKFVLDTALGEAKKKSRSQLEATVSRVNDALFGNPGRLDRDLWLSRLSELLVQTAHPSSTMRQFHGLQRAMREGEAEIDLRGYSHVFVSGPGGSSAPSSQEPLPDRCGPHALQEVFGLPSLRDLLRSYATGDSLESARAAVGDPARPWTVSEYRLPAARPTWQRDSEKKPAEATAAPAAAPPLQFEKRDVDSGAGRSQSAPAAEGASTEPPTPRATAPSDSPESFQALVSRHSLVPHSEANSEWLDRTVLQLRQALTSYDLQAKVVGSRLTPNAALIRLQGSDRLQVKDIESRRSQLLTSHGLNVISVVARPRELIVAIERPERETVSLWNVWKSLPDRKSDSEPNLCLLVGLKEIDGEPLLLNLGDPKGSLPAHAPHTLVAGTTGSGKSILIQNLLLDLAVTNGPKQVRVYVIDPKMGVDYFPLEALPHFAEPIITEQPHALEVLEALVAEMDRRYALFRDAKVNKLSAYNAKQPPGEKLPVLFLVHDEFAEWMLTDTYRAAVTSVVSRLSVKARAAGIHLIFAAQRPDNTVMPMQLRDNLGNRLVLRVEGEGTSEIALGTRGAERLLGRGHCAARLAGEPDVIYAQVPYLDPEDASRVVATLQ